MKFLLIISIIILTSCKTTVYRYESLGAVNFYILKQKYRCQIFIPPRPYDGMLNSDCKNVVIDSLLSKYQYEPYEGRVIKKNYKKTPKGIILKEDNRIDSLLINNDYLQINKQSAIRYIYDLYATSNGDNRFAFYSGDFNVKYIGDSCHLFRNQLLEKTYIFEFYPQVIKDSNQYVYPLRISFSQNSAVPLDIEYYNRMMNPPFKRYIRCEYYGKYIGNLKKLKKVLF